MSRIGKKPIQILENVEVKIDDRKVTVKGPKGELFQEIPEGILVIKENDKIIVSSEKKSKKNSALWGLIRVLLQNQVIGVSSGFEKKLEMRGIGYRASLLNDKNENILKLEVGFSHPVEVKIPLQISLVVEKNIINISGIDKQKIGEFAAKIRKIRPPEPYKGKGIRYLGEFVRKKAGKKVASTG
ncbi:50S ribosomal protein L6 [Patescibacteria group bacterium]|nr:50S ribosomal protein L6 [Patescibacteria group bacterium]